MTGGPVPAREAGSEASGSRFGPYVVEGELARGGMGVVHLARDVRTGARVAVKTCLVRREAVRALDDEIRALRRLRHPGVVRVLEHGEEDGLPWFAMAFVEGLPLRERLASLGTVTATGAPTVLLEGGFLDGPLPDAVPVAGAPDPADRTAVLSLFVRLCDTLAWVHGEGMVHGDLKPDNVIVTPDGRPVLVDFGLHQSGGGAERLVQRRRRGTLPYLSPEQCRGDAVDARSDLYAVGCMLFEALTGRTPFVGTPLELVDGHLHVAAPAASDLVPGLPEALDGALARLLAKVPARRVSSAEELAEVLLAAGARSDPDPGPRPRPTLLRSAVHGRDEDRARLGRAGPFGLVVGSPGSGRSRLLQELASAAQGSLVLPVSGRPEDGRDAARRLLRALVDAAPDAARAERWFGRDPGVLAALEPAVARLAPAPAPVGPALGRDAEVERAAVALTRVLAACAPVLLLVDDADDADPILAAVVRGLLRRRLPGIALRAAAGPDSALVEAFRAAGAEVVALGPLPDEALERLLAERLGVDRAPAEVVAVVRARADGNPMVAGELLSVLVARGILARRHGRWSVTGDPMAAVASLAHADDLAAERLAGLSPETLASLELLAALEDTPLPRPLDLAEARARGLVEPTPEGWRFVHARVAARLRHALPDARRRALHAEIAASLGPDVPSWHHARHLAAAGEQDRAVPIWRRLLVDPGVSHAVREGAAEALLATPELGPERSELRIAWISHLHAAARFDDALRHADLLVAESAGGPRSLLARVLHATLEARAPTHGERLRELLAEAVAAGCPREEGLACVGLADQYDADAVGFGERAVALLAAHGGVEDLGPAELRLANALLRASRLPEARAMLERAERDLREPSHRLLVSGTRALVCVNLGDLDGAEAAARRAHELALAHGGVRALANCVALRGEVARIDGRFAEARDWMAQAEALAEEAGSLEILAKVAHSRAVLAAQLGDTGEALERCLESIDLNGRVGNLRVVAAAHLCRARVLADAQRPAEAVGPFEEAARRYAEVGDRGGVVNAWVGLGRAAVSAGRVDEARATLARCEDELGRLGLTTGPYAESVARLRGEVVP